MASLQLYLIWVVFATTFSIAMCQTTGCGGYYYATSGSVTSPSYPGDYSDNLNCYYYIQVPAPYSVTLTFVDFYTEPCCDWLQVNCTIGNTVMPQRIKGVDLPPKLSFQSCSQISLYFHTDGSVVHRGFNLLYRTDSPIFGGISTAPINYFALNKNYSDKITLNCTSSSGYYPWWSYSSNGVSFDIITNATCQVSSGLNTYAMYSTIPVLGSYSCQLVISPSSSVFGVYTCTDSSLASASAIVDDMSSATSAVAWINNNQTCLNSDAIARIGNNQACSNTDVIEGEQVMITCAISASFSFTQLKTWHYISSENERLSNDSLVSVSSNEFSINVTVPPERLPSYTCNIYFKFPSYTPSSCATNLPQNPSVSTKPLQVSYPPKQDNITIIGAVNGKIDPNGQLICYVPAFPPANYSWTDVSLGITVKSSTFHVSHDGTYMCTATNFIKGAITSVSKSINVTINGEHINTVTLIVGVVLGAVVLILIVINVILLALLLRKKKTPQTVNVNSGPPAVAKRYVDVHPQNEDPISRQRRVVTTVANTTYNNQDDFDATASEASCYESISDKMEPQPYEILK